MKCPQCNGKIFQRDEYLSETGAKVYHCGLIGCNGCIVIPASATAPKEKTNKRCPYCQSVLIESTKRTSNENRVFRCVQHNAPNCTYTKTLPKPAATPKHIPWSNQDYISEFLSLKCSGDVLNVCSPIGKKAKKEISEAMSAIKEIRKIALKYPMKYRLMDLCAGNALTSVVAIHLLPISYAFAYDIRERKRDWLQAKRFQYHVQDLNYWDYAKKITENDIIVAVHPCSKMAEKVVRIYNSSKASHLILIPCCNGHIKPRAPKEIVDKLGKYMMWCWQLADSCNGKFKIDPKNLSPKNIIITAKK